MSVYNVYLNGKYIGDFPNWDTFYTWLCKELLQKK